MMKSCGCVPRIAPPSATHRGPPNSLLSSLRPPPPYTQFLLRRRFSHSPVPFGIIPPFAPAHGATRSPTEVVSCRHPPCFAHRDGAAPVLPSVGGSRPPEPFLEGKGFFGCVDLVHGSPSASLPVRTGPFFGFQPLSFRQPYFIEDHLR